MNLHVEGSNRPLKDLSRVTRWGPRLNLEHSQNREGGGWLGFQLGQMEKMSKVGDQEGALGFCGGGVLGLGLSWGAR